MFYKILGLSTAIILTGSLIEGTTNPSFATNVGNQLSLSHSNQGQTINTTPDSLGNSYQIAQARTHRVRLGDTLGGIANKFGISFKQLLSYNPHLRSRPHLIYVGENINVGGSTSSYQPSVSRSSGRTYTVRSGDTLGGIAIRHGLSLRTILAYNPQLASRRNSINVGEKINVGSAKMIRRTSQVSYTPPRTTRPTNTVSKPVTNNPTPNTTSTSTASAPPRRQSIFNQLPTERRVGSNNTGSKRGPGIACTPGGKHLRAIAPANGLGYTFDDYPYFFWYFPGVENAEGIDFMLYKQTMIEDTGELEHTRVYRQKLNLDKSGIVAFALPSQQSQPLEEGEEYRWRIRIKCSGRTAMNLSYSIKRQSTENPELIAKLESAPVDRHPLVFAESGVWFDALKMIALQLEQAPENPVLQQDWNDVLREIEFDDLIGEPIQYIQPDVRE